MADLHLLISEGGQVLGQTFSSDNAVRHRLVSRDNIYVVSGPKDLQQLPTMLLATIADDVGGADDVQKLWRQLRKQRGVPYWGKVSVKKVIRSLYSDPKAFYTKEQLLDLIPGATWISITTAFSMLKNKRYSDGEPLVIERDEFGNYTRAK